MSLKPDPSSIVEEYKIGNTTIRIVDTAYKNRTPEEIQQTLKRISEISWKIIQSNSAKEKAKQLST